MTINEIIAAVAAEYGVEAADITSKRQDHEVALPRQIAIWLARQFTHLSYPTLGRKFKRSNATALYSQRIAQERLYWSSSDWNHVTRICASLGAQQLERPTR